MRAKVTCGKIRYPDECEAGKALKRSQARAERNGWKPPLRFYEHAGPGGCGGFHLTSKEDECHQDTGIFP